MFALDFFLPGLGKLTSAFAKALTKGISFGLKIYNKVATIVSSMQLAGMAMQGQVKDFFVSVGLGIMGGLVSQVTSAIKNGIRDALFNGKFDELADIFVGAWKGLKAGLITLGRTIERAFDNFPKNLIPWYGNYCSPSATGSNAPGSGTDAFDDGVCRPHDMEYQRDLTPEELAKGLTRNDIKFGADKSFLKRALFGLHDPSVSGFDIAFSGQYGGRPMIGSVYRFLSIPAIGTLAVGRKLGGAQ